MWSFLSLVIPRRPLFLIDSSPHLFLSLFTPAHLPLSLATHWLTPLFSLSFIALASNVQVLQVKERGAHSLSSCLTRTERMLH